MFRNHHIDSPIRVHDCVQTMGYCKYCAGFEFTTDCHLNKYMQLLEQWMCRHKIILFSVIFWMEKLAYKLYKVLIMVYNITTHRLFKLFPVCILKYHKFQGPRSISDFMVCWPCITVYQHSETNVMHFLFNLLRIRGLYMFQALLAHPQEAMHKWHFVCCVRIMSVGCTNPGAANWHNMHAIYQVSFVQHLLRMSK
jgi:hypothetical protein